MKTGLTLTVCFILLHSSLCIRGLGQSYSVDWHTIDGGGGTSTGGIYFVSGTIGQPDAGMMSGGNYTLRGGFWALYALQTPGAPALLITCSGNTVTVYWQDVSGWSLQQNDDLSLPAN